MDSVQSGPPPGGQPLILALSGGGYRGYFTALVLAGLERRLGVPSNRIFDMFAGTSIGGIVALGLAHGVPAETIAGMIKEHGPAIFPKLPFASARRLFGPPYRSEPLARSVRFILNTHASSKIGQSPKPVMVVAVSPTTSRIALLSSWEQGSGSTVTVIDAALATSAAPTYFPVHRAKLGSGGMLDLVDGGIAANAPDMLAVHQAVQHFGWDEDKIRVLSIGTCASASGGTSPVDRDRFGIPGTLGRLGGRGLVNLMMSVQEGRGIGEARERLGHDRYLRLDRTPSDTQSKHLRLDNASDEAAQILAQLAQELDIGHPEFLSSGVWRAMVSRAQLAKV